MMFTCSDAIKSNFSLNVYCWHIGNKHDGSVLVANALSTLRPLDSNAQPRFYCFSSVNECQPLCDRSMVVLYLAFHGSHWYCQFV